MRDHEKRTHRSTNKRYVLKKRGKVCAPLNRLLAALIQEMRASERRYPDVRFNGYTEYSAVPLFTAYGCSPCTGNILNIDTTLSSPVIFLRFRVN